MNFKFCTHIHGINRKNSPLKILGKVANSENFQGTHNRVHCAVIFAIAQLTVMCSSLI